MSICTAPKWIHMALLLGTPAVLFLLFNRLHEHSIWLRHYRSLFSALIANLIVIGSPIVVLLLFAGACR